MARIVFGQYMIPFPMGGYQANNLQFIRGLTRLGHEVYVVEKSAEGHRCFDPVRRTNSDDCSYGLGVARDFFARFGLADRWTYLDGQGTWHGLGAERVREIFRSADLFIDYGAHGAWADEAAHVGCRVLIDGEPGFRQIHMERQLAAGEPMAAYDFYFTVGRNLGTTASNAPLAGRVWRPIFDPIDFDLYPEVVDPPFGAAFSTILNWQNHATVEHGGVRYGQKNREFERFRTLPSLTAVPLELALTGATAPVEALRAGGWRVRDALEVTLTFDSLVEYIQGSVGEFAFAKEVFVALKTGWFSDRSSIYLALGRPVVLQETGFSAHLPVGEGLFAVASVEEAADAIARITGDYARHSKRAREIAWEYLDAPKVMGGMLEAIGIPALAASL